MVHLPVPKIRHRSRLTQQRLAVVLRMLCYISDVGML